MTLTIVWLALLAALLHAAWNVMVKTAGDPLRLLVRAMVCGALAGTLVALPAWLLTGRPGFPLGAWLLAVASSAVEVLYFVFLSLAYRRGDLASTYAVARGSSPVLAVAAGVIILGERLTGMEYLGIACVLAGIWAVQRPAARRGTVFALLTGTAIATYTALDSAGVGLVAPWLYGWVLWMVTAVLLVATMRVWRRPEGSTSGAGGPELRLPWRMSAVAGILMAGAYLCVLVALRLAPLAVVAPLRESAVVLVAVWSVWRLHERRGSYLRLSGAVAVVAGITLLALR